MIMSNNLGSPAKINIYTHAHPILDQFTLEW